MSSKRREKELRLLRAAIVCRLIGLMEAEWLFQVSALFLGEVEVGDGGART
jgi:hypothetical protein